MNAIINQALATIESQQTGKEGTAPWMVGEQLKDICRTDARVAEIILQDLSMPEMGIVDAEKQIKAYADAHKKGGFSCVIPSVAETILRKFYGVSASVEAPTRASSVVDIVDLL